MNLNDMTFEVPAQSSAPTCDLPGHGPECIGHAWRVNE